MLDLNGAYKAFEAKVGVQRQANPRGSVVFKVLVDGKECFNSGIMRQTDDVRTVHVPVTKAAELRLVITDAGDGTPYDMADWLDPVLIRDIDVPLEFGKSTVMDIAPFARVVTGDPERLNGCSANRVQEFHAEDVFLERDICSEKDGTYHVAPAAGGKACIGLRWLENRTPTRLSITFADMSAIPSVDKTQLQIWQGESPWQGEWKVYNVKIEQQGNQFTCAWRGIDCIKQRIKTRKIRWVFSDLTSSVAVKSLSAFYPVQFQSLDIVMQMEPDHAGGKRNIELYNAELNPEAGQQTRVWDTAQPLHLKLRLARPQMENTPTSGLLRLRWAEHISTVSLDDVLANGIVYVPAGGLYVARESNYVTLADYKQRIAQKQTILDRVKEMPDQTLAQAMEKTHNPIQDNGPMLLSLACDNFKIVSDRDASIIFSCERPGGGPAGMKTVWGKSQNQQARRFLEGGWVPIPVVTVSSEGVTYTQRAYVAPFDSSGDERPWPYICDRPIGVAEYAMENTGDGEAEAVLSLQFYDNTEGAAPIQLQENPKGVAACQNGRVLAWMDISRAMGLRAEISSGKLTLTGKIAGRSAAYCNVFIPAWKVEPAEGAALAVKDNLRQEVKAHWDKVLAGAMKIEIPDPFLQNVVKASQVHCLLAARNEDSGRHIAAWISSDRYGPLESEAHSVIRGMDFFGNTEYAEQSYDYFIQRYNAAGFLTTGYTLLGTGWHLWSLGEHFMLTQDLPWLKQRENEIARVCEWISQQRQKTRETDCTGRKVLEYGLMPPGVLADWNTFAYHFCLSAYFYAGLKASADMLVQSGHEGAASLQQDAADFREDILRCYHRMQTLTPAVGLQNGTSVTGYPSQAYLCGPVNNFFPGEDGNRSWCYDVELGASQLVPTGVLDPMEVGTTDMLNHMEDVQFLTSGLGEYPAEKSRADWFNLGGFAKVQPYYCRNAEIYALRDDIKPFIRSYFNSLASLLNTENLSLWEHFHNIAGWNKTHETGYFLYQTRTMLLTERGDALWITPLVTTEWLKDGMSIKVQDAPTRFGKVSYQINSHVKEGYIEAAIDSPTRTVPQQLVLRLRHPEGKPLQRVWLNDAPHTQFDSVKECIYVTPGSEQIRIRAEY